MTFIPAALLRNLYNHSSLRNSGDGVRFSVKNRLSPASLKRIERVSLDGEEIHPDRIAVTVDSGDAVPDEPDRPGQPGGLPAGHPADLPPGGGPARGGQARRGAGVRDRALRHA